MRFRVRPLEERIVLDAAVVGDAGAAVTAFSEGDYGPNDAVESSDIEQVTGDGSGGGESSDSVELTSSTVIDLQEGGLADGLRVLVVSSQVRDANVLGDAALEGVAVIYYDASDTSLSELSAEIADVLVGQKADSIAFVNHGMEGQFQLLDGVTVSSEALSTIPELASFWRSIGDVVKDGGRVDLLACNLAANAEGQQVLSLIDTFLDAGSGGGDIAVAASTDLTGSDDYSGDWYLEIGDVDVAATYFNAEEISEWSGVLTTFNVTSFVDGDPGSLRAAIIAANADTSDPLHIINVPAGTHSLAITGDGEDSSATGDLDITNSVSAITIQGQGLNTTVIEAPDFFGDRIFHHLTSTTLTLNNLGVVNGGPTNFATGTEGGGLFSVSGGQIFINEVRFLGNDSLSEGGAIYAAPALLTIDNSYFVLNTASTAGGAIFYSGSASGDLLVITDSTFESNSAASGGALSLTSNASVGTVSIVNSTFSENSAAGGFGDGAAISTFQVQTPDLDISHSTFSKNASMKGALFLDGGSRVNLSHNIFDNLSNATDVNLVEATASDSVNSLGFNIVTDSSLTTPLGSDQTGSLVTPGLAGLAFNGGPTPTHALSVGSDAIDKGDPAIVTTLTTDQRGVPFSRISPTVGGTIDIGAYEVQVNTDPTANAQTVNLNEDGSSPITLTGSDPDPFDTLTFTIVGGTGPSFGMLTGTGAARTYTPNPDYNGPDSFDFMVDDGNGGTDTATVTINVAPINDGPNFTVPLAQNVVEDGVLNVPGLSISDVDLAEGTNLATVALSVANGVLSVPPAVGLTFTAGANNSAAFTMQGTPTVLNTALASLQYAPTPNFNGADVLNFTVNDLGNTGAPGAIAAGEPVNITVTPVNDAPVTNDDVFAGDEEALITGNVLTNDNDFHGGAPGENNPFTAQLVAGTTNGTLVLNPNGTFEYTGNVGFDGVDTFTYRAVDADPSNVATVTINVANTIIPTTTSGNPTTTGAPSGPGGGSGSPDGGGQGSSTPSGDGSSGSPFGRTLGFNNGIQPQGGDMFVTGDGGSLVIGEEGEFTYAPDPDFTGLGVITYDIGGVEGGPRYRVEIRIHVTSFNLFLRSDWNTFDLGDVFGDGAGPLPFFDEAQELHLLFGPDHGGLQLNEDGTFTYVPSPDFTGTTDFSFETLDEDGAVTSQTSVEVKITEIQDAEAP